MSCRVLGRGIEAAIPNIAAKIVAAEGFDILKAEIIETERNTPARNVYNEAGFLKLNSDSIWKLETNKQIVSKWIEYTINKDASK